ncbi:ferritin, heavy subunit-like [Montipora capricornis]|uniref:ferritin, heavy subunit-like n=1 Tax=Montipora capricornis TaxID=246305 RepID=UPI0035F14EC2
MFTLLISLFIAIHYISAHNHDCSFSIYKHIYQDNTRWTYPLKNDYNGMKTESDPLPFMTPFSKNTSGEINKQINRELFAHYNYLSMAMHFDRDDIHLPGFHKFFKESAEEEMKHAQMLMKYQNMRGGRVRLHNVHTPFKSEWGNGLGAMECALNLEKEVYETLLGLHNVAQEANDPQLQDFLEGNYLGEQVESIKQLSDYVNTLRRLQASGNYALGEYQFDKNTLKGRDD